jgi:hypothetical protein
MKIEKHQDHISIHPKSDEPNYEYRIDLTDCQTWDQCCEQIKLIALYSWATLEIITEIADMIWPREREE